MPRFRSTFFLITLCLVARCENARCASALQLAQTELDRMRDDTHKREVKVIWTDAPVNDAVNVPGDAEVYLIRGYIDHTCTRLRWHNGTVQAERIVARRTWFYNAHGESIVGERLMVAATDFIQAWQAAALIANAKSELIHPPAPRSIEEDLFSSRSHMTSSHEHSFWVRLHVPGGDEYRHVSRGMDYRDKIQDFKTLQHRAISSVFERLCPETKNAATNPVLPLAEWDAFLTAELKAYGERMTLESTRDEDKLMLETALRILGQSGCFAAEAEIKRLREKLAPATEEQHFWAYSLRSDADYALAKIDLQNRWNAPRAIELIHANPRRINADNDLTQWVRNQFFARDPQSYHALLLQDLRSVDNPDLLRETLKEMGGKFFGADLKRIADLMTHVDAEVAADAALMLLDDKLNPRPDPLPARVALERLASDPHTSIPSRAQTFHFFGRHRALTYLTAHARPAGERWTPEHVRQLLRQPDDGRMVYELLTALNILDSPATGAEKIEAYRRSLALPYTRGTLTACEELAELKDIASGPLVSKVLAEIRTGCNKNLSWRDDPDARYPWTDKYELDELTKKWTAAKNGIGDVTPP